MIQGYDRWRSKLPDYQGCQILVFPLLAITSMIVGQAYLLTLEWLSRLYPDFDILVTLEPVLPVVGTLTGIVGGFAGIYQLWARRDRYLAESEETAYQRALPFGVVGAGLLFTTMLNGFVPVYQLSRRALEHPLSIGLADPAVTWPLRVILGSTVLGIAMVFGARTIRTFGIDYMLVVYLYYPEESTVQNHDIYSVIRHPTYAGWLLVVLSTTLFRASVYGAIDFVLFYLAVTVWARRVEERELVERSGEDYRKYMREVPAFVPRPDGWGRVVTFLLGRD